MALELTAGFWIADPRSVRKCTFIALGCASGKVPSIPLEDMVVMILLIGVHRPLLCHLLQNASWYFPASNILMLFPHTQEEASEPLLSERLTALCLPSKHPGPHLSLFFLYHPQDLVPTCTPIICVSTYFCYSLCLCR